MPDFVIRGSQLLTLKLKLELGKGKVKQSALPQVLF